MYSAPDTATSLLVDEQLRTRVTDEALDDGQPNIAATLKLARNLAELDCQPGTGATLSYVRALATLGLVDATVARVAEPHLDARAILTQAGFGPVIEQIGADDSSTWGVYAAHATGYHLQATETTRGLAAVPSGPIAMSSLPAVALGPPNWYVERAGFGWGAIGVAAVWYGITLGVQEELHRHAAAQAADPIMLAQLGAADELVFATATCLTYAAAQIDAGLCASAGALLAARVRAVTARTAEKILQIAGHAMGPGPLVSQEAHSRRVADLSVYVRQHHGERDLASLGRLVLDTAGHGDA